jgi:TfoX/Sxy family transcriptional regulator of competence genes
MAYDEGLAQRVRELIEVYPMVDEKKMFGGVGFMIEGNIACGVLKDELIVRVGPSYYQEALRQMYSREFDITGRPMQGWIMVQAEGYESDQALKEWVEMGIEFALTLPPK